MTPKDPLSAQRLGFGLASKLRRSSRFRWKRGRYFIWLGDRRRGLRQSDYKFDLLEETVTLVFRSTDVSFASSFVESGDAIVAEGSVGDFFKA